MNIVLRHVVLLLLDVVGAAAVLFQLNQGWCISVHLDWNCVAPLPIRLHFTQLLTVLGSLQALCCAIEEVVPRCSKCKREQADGCFESHIRKAYHHLPITW